MRQPPGPARWLLSAFLPTPSDSLLGDLQEEFEAGRSSGWYWRQVLRAVGAAAIHGIRVHPLQAFSAVGVGWVALIAFFYWCFYFVATFGEQLFVRGLVDIRYWWPGGHWSLIGSACLGHFISGWLVARVHSRYMVLPFLTTVWVWNFAAFVAIFMGVPKPPFHEFRFWLINVFMLMPLSILLGGLLGDARRTSKASQVLSTGGEFDSQPMSSRDMNKR